MYHELKDKSVSFWRGNEAYQIRNSIWHRFTQQTIEKLAVDFFWERRKYDYFLMGWMPKSWFHALSHGQELAEHGSGATYFQRELLMHTYYLQFVPDRSVSYTFLIPVSVFTPSWSCALILNSIEPYCSSMRLEVQNFVKHQAGVMRHEATISRKS